MERSDHHATASCCYSFQVDVEDISKVYSLFVDVKRSTQFLLEYQEQYMFNEVPGLGEDEIVAEQAEQRQQQQGGAEGMEVSS
jgi:RuvB-like protein 2